MIAGIPYPYAAVILLAGFATGLVVWTIWGWPWMRRRYYRGKGVPPAEM